MAGNIRISSSGNNLTFLSYTINIKKRTSGSEIESCKNRSYSFYPSVSFSFSLFQASPNKNCLSLGCLSFCVCDHWSCGQLLVHKSRQRQMRCEHLSQVGIFNTLDFSWKRPCSSIHLWKYICWVLNLDWNTSRHTRASQSEHTKQKHQPLRHSMVIWREKKQQQALGRQKIKKTSRSLKYVEKSWHMHNHF